MTRKVFYSFHYMPDNWRVAQVRNMGVIDGNPSAADNDWETIRRGGDRAIEEWISDQMHGRSCTVVLVGANTADRKWINYEIVKSWNDRKGVVGIHIHGLKDSNGCISSKGENPFESINYGNTGKKLSSVVSCYNPVGSNSKDIYDYIQKCLAPAVEFAIDIRKKN